MGRKKKSEEGKPDSLPTAEDISNVSMTANQFCTWLKSMDWDTTEEKLAQAGIALGKTTRQLRKYTSGTAPIPRSIALSCLFLTRKREEDAGKK